MASRTMKVTGALALVFAIGIALNVVTQPSQQPPKLYSKIREYFARGDLVALVRITEGRASTGDCEALYSAEIERDFKGSSVGSTISFHDDDGLQIYGRYLLFAVNSGSDRTSLLLGAEKRMYEEIYGNCVPQVEWTALPGIHVVVGRELGGPDRPWIADLSLTSVDAGELPGQTVTILEQGGPVAMYRVELEALVSYMRSGMQPPVP